MRLVLVLFVQKNQKYLSGYHWGPNLDVFSSLEICFYIEVFCFYLTLLQKYSMNVILDNFPLLGSVVYHQWLSIYLQHENVSKIYMYHQGLCIYLQHENVSSIYVEFSLTTNSPLPFCLLIRLHQLLKSALDLTWKMKFLLAFFVNKEVTSARIFKGCTFFT